MTGSGWMLFAGGQAMNLDHLPRGLQPVVQAIDDWNRGYKLGMIYECRVGAGRLVVCSVDISAEKVTAVALRKSLLAYMRSERFGPAIEIAAGDLREEWVSTRTVKREVAATQNQQQAPEVDAPTEGPATRRGARAELSSRGRPCSRFHNSSRAKMVRERRNLVPPLAGSFIMADTTEIMAAAGGLGALVATHPVVMSYKETIRQLDLDVGAKALLQQYEQLIEQLSMKESQMQPIEIAEKKQFEQLQQAIMMNQTLKKFAQVQGEYMDLMKKVQEAINEGMSGKLPAGAAAPGAAPAAPSKIILDT